VYNFSFLRRGFSILLLLLCLTVYGQKSVREPQVYTVSGDIFGTRNFIENKGQFKNPVNASEPVLFYYEHRGECIYFTKHGLIHQFASEKELSERERDRFEEAGQEPPTKRVFHYVNMNWLNQSAAISVEGQGKQGFYFTYGAKELDSYPYNKILYKNVYNNIDIEYTLPQDKEHGVKYNVILHPGASLSDIQIAYTGEMKKMKLLSDGNVTIRTPLDDITEHAPVAFEPDNKPVPVSFSLENNILGFSAPAGYTPSKGLTIDPWVTAITTLSTNNCGYDVDWDYMGNTYVYGGTYTNNAAGKCKIAKYNSTGTLLWTFAGIISNPSWNTGTSWTGNFKVAKSFGKIYVSRSNTQPHIIRLDATGNYDNFISNGSISIGETWHTDIECTGDLIVYGGINQSGEIVSTATGSITLVTTFNPTITGCCQDVVSPAIDATGNAFVYFLGHTSLANKICRVTQSFTNNVWQQPSGFSGLSYLANKSLYQNAGAGNAVAFNALDVNMNYLYYYDGYSVAAYNKATGAMTGSTTISGQTARYYGGIAVDDCDNVYVGGNGAIHCFNFNGTNFNSLGTISLSTSVTYPHPYDVQLNKFSKVLYVSGNEFVGNYSAIYSQSCSAVQATNACSFGQGTISTTTHSITCANLGSATVTAIGGIGPFSYTWIPSGQTGSVATGLAPGNYTVLVYDATTNFSYQAVAVFSPLVPLSGNVQSSGLVPCYGAATATAAVPNLAGGSGSQSYVWKSPTSTLTAASPTGMAAGNWSVTIVDALTGCVFNQTFAILQPSQLGAFISVSSPTACIADSVNLSPVVSGGSPPYTYSWTNGPNTSSYKVSAPTPGVRTYTVSAWDQFSCPVAASGSVDYIGRPALQLTNVFICPLETATLTALGATNYTWSNALTGASFTASPAATTVYTVTGESLLCTSSGTASINIKPLPVPVSSNNSPLCVNSPLQLNVSGGSSYIWTGPQSFSSTVQNPLFSSATLTHAGVYNVTVTAANACTASTSQTVVVNPNPTVSVTGATVCTTQTINLTSTSFTGVTYQWWGPNNFSSTDQNPIINNPPVQGTGGYLLKVTTAAGCTNAATAPVQVINPPALSAPLSSNSLCAQALNGSPNTITLSAQGANTYTLSTPGNIVNAGGPPPYSLSSGPPYYTNMNVATATLAGSNGICTSSLAVSFSIMPNPTVTISSPTPVICEGRSFTYTSMGATGYTWGPTSQGIVMYSNGGVAVANPTISSVFSVVGSSIGCNSALVTTSLTVYPIPTVFAKPTFVEICPGTSTMLGAYGTATSFMWSPGNGLNSITGTTVMSKPSADITYTVTGSANNCTNTAITTVSILPLPVPFATSYNASVCVGEPITLSGDGGVGYEWSGPNQFYYAGKSTTFIASAVGIAGIYTLTVTDLRGCRNSTTTSVGVKPLPQGGLAASQLEGCVPFRTEFKFTSNSPSTISSWVLNTSLFQTKAFSYYFDKAGNYLISGRFTDTISRCSNSYSMMVHVYDLPTADFSWLPATPVERTGDVLFINETKGEQVEKFNWYFVSNNGFKSQNRNTSYFFEDAGTYPVVLVVSDMHGCSDTIVKKVTVEPDFVIYIPNVFTPNADERNEVFIPVMRGVGKFTFSIFNRWGEKIFESSDPLRGWDGTHNGVLCKEDIYTYRVTLTTLRGEPKVYNGYVTFYK
jgi:gliding motility-associated-like protein